VIEAQAIAAMLGFFPPPKRVVSTPSEHNHFMEKFTAFEDLSKHDFLKI